jgi:hypothetical protein
MSTPDAQKLSDYALAHQLAKLAVRLPNDATVLIEASKRLGRPSATGGVNGGRVIHLGEEPASLDDRCAVAWV